MTRTQRGRAAGVVHTPRGRATRKPTPRTSTPRIPTPQRSAPRPLTSRFRLLWTLGNILMLVGVVVLLYVGGLYATDAYGRYAARGDSDVPAPVAVEESEGSPVEEEPAPFVAPMLNNGQPLPIDQAAKRSTVTRLIIPSVDIDAKVVDVGWDMAQVGDEQVATWQVAKYAVGHHQGSANPGEGENIVMAGHVGGFGHVFRDLYYVHPGEEVLVFSGDQQFRYVVQQRMIVDEEGVSAEQHAENAKLIASTGKEEVTLVTCWPPTGKDKFKQRVVVRAVPFSAGSVDTTQSSWSIR